MDSPPAHEDKITPFTIFILSLPPLWLAIILRPFVSIEAVQNYIDWVFGGLNWLPLSKTSIDPSYVIVTVILFFLTVVPFSYGLFCKKEENTPLSRFFLIWTGCMAFIVLILPFIWGFFNLNSLSPLINSQTDNQGIFTLPEFFLIELSFSFPALAIDFNFELPIIYYGFLFYPFLVSFIELGLGKTKAETPFLIGSSIALFISYLGSGILSLSDLPDESVTDIFLGYGPIMVVISAIFFVFGYLFSLFYQQHSRTQ